jgi:hypothetical protein
MRRIFWGFCRNWFLMSPLHYLLGRSDFGLEFAEIFIFEKRLPAITNTGSRRLPVSVSRGVDDSPHHRYGESAIDFLKENSLYRWYGESATPHTSDTVSHRLPISLSWRVADSAYHRYGESTTPRIVESGSRWLRGLVIRGVAIQRKN